MAVAPVHPTNAAPPASPAYAPTPQVAVPTPQVAAPPATPDRPSPALPPDTTAPPAPAEPSTPGNVTVTPTPAARSLPWSGAPWAWALGICIAALGLRLLARAVRRELTLRHLARPFWAETLDQRISNHWQRMLVGLRDAGIRPLRDEPPQTFARRVGIEGVETCATILDRVRHGLRVDATDLEAMAGAATAAYRAARRTAGLPGRAVAWLRWPLT
jgi:hypothetical protein